MKIVVRGDEGVVSSASMLCTNDVTKLSVNTHLAVWGIHSLGFSETHSGEFKEQIDSITVEDVNWVTATVILVPESGDDYLWFNNCTRYHSIEGNKVTVIWIPNKTELREVLASYTTGE